MPKLVYKGNPINSVPAEAKYITYDNTSSGLSGYNVQTALDNAVTILSAKPNVYSGTGDPSDSVGNDGDIYIKITE